MVVRFILLCFFILISFNVIKAQCVTPINSFPYNQGFETNNGGWAPGGVGNDWAWGTPAKSTISSAGGGTKCWVVGGLTGNVYTDGQASWLQSPCFDFTNLPFPYIQFKVFWEMEQQFDGASFQYSIDGGGEWFTIGIANNTDCLNKNWYNQSPVTYLSPLTNDRQGWSGNKQSTSGSCKGGRGSNGWLTASQIMPGLGSRSSVIFRFIFGAGTICNNYDGFAIDDIMISNVPPITANFNYVCGANKTVNFIDESIGCPDDYNWDFGDPASGTNNTATGKTPSHSFSAAGKYTVSLTITHPYTAASTTTQEVTVMEASAIMLSPADCETNRGGSLVATGGLAGDPRPFSFIWNTNPLQTGVMATNLAAGTYNVTVSGPGVCPVTASAVVETDRSCIGIYFPSAFTPDGNDKNDGFGPLGGVVLMSNYKLSVFNRWGERVFYSTNPLEKWDGKVKGLKTDSNIFAWFSEYTLPTGKQFKKGTILLIR